MLGAPSYPLDDQNTLLLQCKAQYLGHKMKNAPPRERRRPTMKINFICQEKISGESRKSDLIVSRGTS